MIESVKPLIFNLINLNDFLIDFKSSHLLIIYFILDVFKYKLNNCALDSNLGQIFRY